MVIPTNLLLVWVPDYFEAQPPLDDQGDSLAYMEMRTQVQRNFVASKRNNVAPYQRYIEQTSRGERQGSTPEITIWCAQALEIETTVDPDGDVTTRVRVPPGLAFVALDGETQRVARQRAALNVAAVAKEMVSVRVIHGRSLDEAGQIFYDRNTLGVNSARSDALALDLSDPATLITRRLSERADSYLKGRVRQHGKSLPDSDHLNVVMVSSLRTGVVTALCGRGGIQLGSKPVAQRFKSGELEQVGPLVEAAWFAFFHRYQTEFEYPRRLTSLVNSPSVLAAVGILINCTLPHPIRQSATALSLEELWRLLDDVNWQRSVTNNRGQVSSHWEGIAGKCRGNGVLIKGGPNEYTRQITEALLNPESAGGVSVRTLEAQNVERGPDLGR